MQDDHILLNIEFAHVCEQVALLPESLSQVVGNAIL
jgi:hypothetical protein